MHFLSLLHRRGNQGTKKLASYLVKGRIVIKSQAVCYQLLGHPGLIWHLIIKQGTRNVYRINGSYQMSTLYPLHPSDPNIHYLHGQMDEPSLEQKSRQIRASELNSYKSLIKSNRSSNRN